MSESCAVLLDYGRRQCGQPAVITSDSVPVCADCAQTMTLAGHVRYPEDAPKDQTRWG